MVNEEGDKVDGATYLIPTRWLGGLALGVPGLRLTMGPSASGPLDMVEEQADILLQRLGRVRSISSLFLHPLSVGSAS